MSFFRWLAEYRAARLRARPTYARAFERAVAEGIVVLLHEPPPDDDGAPPDTPGADAKRLPDEPPADAVAPTRRRRRGSARSIAGSEGNDR